VALKKAVFSKINALSLDNADIPPMLVVHN